MKKLLLVIDVQKSFITEDTKKILPKIEKLIDSNLYDDVVFTRFINSYESRFYKDLNYEGCINESTSSLAIDSKKYKVIEKYAYTSLTDELKEYIKDNNIEKIYLCGFDTNACVLKTALDLFEQDYDFYLLKNYCGSSSGIRLHDDAILNLSILIGSNKII